MKIKFFILGLILPFALSACGSDDSGKVSKGHRDAVHIECKDDPDKKLCGAEVRNSFIEKGNEFVDLNELNKDQRRRVKMECVRSKKYGLESYNNCLQQYKVAALTNRLTEPKIGKKPKSNIEDLEKSVVRVAITEYDADKKKEKMVGYGSGIILDKNYIATNCHVALIAEKGFERLIWITNLNDKTKWANAVIYKKNPGKDVCILKHQPVEKLSLTMNPVRKIKKFSKLKRGDFVRTLGTPKGLMGHTAEGSINYLGKRPFKGMDEDTKFIVHDATIDEGSSGGPLFDKDGYLIGLNTLKAGNMYFSVSADHILEMIR